LKEKHNLPKNYTLVSTFNPKNPIIVNQEAARKAGEKFGQSKSPNHSKQKAEKVWGGTFSPRLGSSRGAKKGFQNPPELQVKKQ